MKRNSRVLALPPGVNWADIDWKESNAEKNARRSPEQRKRRTKLYRQRRKRKGLRVQSKAQSQRKYDKWQRRLNDKHVAKRWQELARVIAADFLEMRAEENEAAIAKFREQQAREAKSFAENLVAQFHNAVKAAAGKAAC